MKRLAVLWVLVVAGCAMPMAVNKHLDALEIGIGIAEANAVKAHDSIETGIVRQRSAAFDAARLDLVRVASTQPNATVDLKTADLVVSQLQKQSAASDTLLKLTLSQRATAMDNYAALRRMIGQAKSLVTASQSVSSEVRAYIDYLSASKAAK